MPHRTFRWLLIAVLVLGGAGLAGYFYLRLSLPRVSGEIEVAGIDGAVEILRDAHGIPHIFARSERDAQFALGFVHAQDRLWQLEMNRRIASGRLAEILGPAALDTDRFLRTLGIRRVAEANLRRLDADSKKLLSAYAAGVNAFLRTKPVLPLEFWILGVQPEPWSEVDTAAWAKMLSWDLGGNWRTELLRLQLAPRLATSMIQELFPPYPGDASPTLPNLRDLYRVLEKEPAQVSALDSLGGASNSWVVSGARTVSGKPLLANDPHLGLSAPNIWYFAHLHAPGLDQIGATLPGVPGIILGRNDRIAWSATNTGPDVQDLYLEKLDGAGGYVAPDGHRPFTVVREKIKVKGAPDVDLDVRISRHGPIISDVLQRALDATPRGHALALAWTALDDDDVSLGAFLKLARAKNWKEFVDATRSLSVPEQNLSYADVDGNIGFIAPAKVPIRKPENDLHGLAPAPGWDSRYDWAGFIPFDELPQAFNPPSGKIVTANHKIVPPGYRYPITYEWDVPYRADRIDQLLESVKKHDRASFERVQADVVSLAARALLPRMVAIQGNSAEASEVLKWLAAWDGAMAADRPEPLIYTAWIRELDRAMYADELGPAFRGAWRSRSLFLDDVLSDRNAESRWCDDVNTPRLETCDEILAASLEKALEDLRRRYGKDANAWKWGQAHEARLRHRPFSRSARLRGYFDITAPSPGDGYTINRGDMDFSEESEPFSNRHASSLRAIYDLADPDDSRFIMPGGQSGNPLSPHHHDLMPLWARGDYLPMVTDRKKLEAAGARRLVLKPGS
ncbi:MAG TPA: penicillin acylase family protein [Burkholderiales bacterium]|nr:penicillin acylase family protein [Burkholderiales bacterium]